MVAERGTGREGVNEFESSVEHADPIIGFDRFSPRHRPIMLLFEPYFLLVGDAPRSSARNHPTWIIQP